MNCTIVPGRFCPPLLLAAVWVAVSIATADAAEYLFIPSLSLEEELNDNVNGDVSKRGDLITHVRPGFNAMYKSSGFDLTATYSLDYQNYATKSMGNKIDNTGQLASQIRINKYLFLDVSDTLKRTSTESLRDVSGEGASSSSGDQNTLTASSTININPGGRLNATTGYRYTKDTYLSGPGVDKNSHEFFLNPNYQLTPRLALTSSASARRTEAESGAAGTAGGGGASDSYDEILSTIGFDYRYADGSQVTVRGGNAWKHFKGGETNNSPYWDVNLTHLSGRTTASLVSGVKYDNSTRNTFTETWDSTATVTRQLDRGSLSGSVKFSRESDAFKGAVTEDLITYTLSGSHALTKSLTGSLKLFFDKKTNYLGGDPYVYHYGADVNLGYDINKKLSLAFEYHYTLYTSTLGNASDYYDINRLLATLTYKFDGISRKELLNPGLDSTVTSMNSR